MKTVTSSAHRKVQLLGSMAVLVAFALPAAPAFGEGSGDLNTGPDGAIRQALTSSGNSNYTVLYVYAQAGETIQLGNSAMGIPGAGNVLVYAPGAAVDNLGTGFPEDPVFATDIFDCDTDDPGTGVIATRAEELAGPLPNAGGYDPCEFAPTATGIYPVIMMSQNPDGVNNLSGFVDAPVQNDGFNIAMWDVTVRDAGGAVQPGRTYSFTYRLRAAASDSGGAQVFPYTKSGYEYRVSFTDQSGVNWFLSADDLGNIDAQTGDRLFASFACGDENNPDVNRPCIHFEATTAPPERRFPLFLNSVDPLVISGSGGLAETLGYSETPIAPGSNPLANTAFTGSAGESGATDQGSGGTISWTSPVAMEGLGYAIAIDFNRNGTFGDGPDVVDDGGELASSGSNTFAWNGRDAAGNVPACGDYPYQIRSTLSEVHFTMTDVENSGGTEIERLSLPTDPALGDPFAASYNNVDPYKTGETVTPGMPPGVVTDQTPVAVTDGDSSVDGFNAWTNLTGNTDLIDTWTRLPEVDATGTLRVLCRQSSTDLAIAKSTPPRYTPDGRIEWTLTVTNNGPEVSSGSTVTDKLPEGITNASSSTPGCTVSGRDLSCALGTLAVGASQEIVVSGRAPANGGKLENCATVEGNEPDSNANNNTDCATTRPLKPKLRIDKKVSKKQAAPGEVVRWTLIARNVGKVDARNVRVCDRLPQHITPVTLGGGELSNGKLCWKIKRLNAKKSKKFSFKARIDGDADPGKLPNTATLNGEGIKDRDRAAVRVRGAQGGGEDPSQVTG